MPHLPFRLPYGFAIVPKGQGLQADHHPKTPCPQPYDQHPSHQPRQLSGESRPAVFLPPPRRTRPPLPQPSCQIEPRPHHEPTPDHPHPSRNRPVPFPPPPPEPHIETPYPSTRTPITCHEEASTPLPSPTTSQPPCAPPQHA